MPKRVLLVASCPGESSFEKKGFLAPSLGLYRIKEYLEAHGHRCRVLEPTLEDAEDQISRLGDLYDIIGFSPLHHSLEYDIGLMWTAKRHTSSLLVAGGIEATLNPSILQKYSPIDHIIYGEGEKPLLSLCEGDFTPRDPLTEKEYREATVGIDLREIPYDFFWSETRRRHRDVLLDESNTVRFVTSSHCPGRCTFCSSSKFLEGRVKYLTGGDIVKLVDKTMEAWPGTRQIFFQDDNFLMGKWGRKRWEEVSGFKFPVHFMGQARLDDVTPEVIDYLSNFRLISVGVESFSQNILNEFKKSLNASEIDERIEAILGAGIGVFINIILTSPNCSREDVKFTIEKCSEWVGRGVDMGINLYVDAYPGTEIVDKEEVEYKEVRVPGTDIRFKKMWRVLPRDRDVREAVLKTERDLEGTVLRSIKRSKLILEYMGRHLGV